MNPDFEVIPFPNPPSGKEGKQLREETLRLAHRVFDFVTSEDGLAAKLIKEYSYGWKLSVHPEAVRLKTGSEYPVTEVWIRHGDGKFIPYDAWGDRPGGHTPIVFSFVGCIFFDEGSGFFNELAAVFCAKGVVFFMGNVP